MEDVSINKSIHLSEHLASPSEAALSHSSELDGLRLTPHFTLGEVTKSKHADIYNRGSPTSNHLTGCAVDIRVYGIEQAMRYAVILMDYADETKQDYDEILIERNRSGGYWLHFAIRPKDNRRKTMFLTK